MNAQIYDSRHRYAALCYSALHVHAPQVKMNVHAQCSCRCFASVNFHIKKFRSGNRQTGDMYFLTTSLIGHILRLKNILLFFSLGILGCHQSDDRQGRGEKSFRWNIPEIILIFAHAFAQLS